MLVNIEFCIKCSSRRVWSNHRIESKNIESTYRVSRDVFSILFYFFSNLNSIHFIGYDLSKDSLIYVIEFLHAKYSGLMIKIFFIPELAAPLWSNWNWSIWRSSLSFRYIFILWSNNFESVVKYKKWQKTIYDEIEAIEGNNKS